MSDQIEGRRPVLEALKAGRTITELFVASGAHTSGALAEIVTVAERRSIPVRLIPRKELESRSSTRNPQGVIALAASFRYASLDDLLARAASSGEPGLFVALDGITDPQNLGALARSAEAAGAHGLIVPERRAAGVTAAAEKAAAGALEHVPVAQVTNLSRALEELKKSNVWIVALDAGPQATSIHDLELATDAVCLVVGGEESGVSRLVREHADVVAHIPMVGQIASLNASAAGAVALFEIRRRRSL